MHLLPREETEVAQSGTPSSIRPWSTRLNHDDDSKMKGDPDGRKHDSDNTGAESMHRWQDIDQREDVGYNMRGKRIAKKKPAFGSLKLAGPLSTLGSLANSYFPLKVDETGFVQLDFGAGSTKDTTTAASSAGGSAPARADTRKKRVVL